MPTTGGAPARDFSNWIPLLASFEQKDRVKTLGARWNQTAGLWMWPPDRPRALVREWLPLCYRDDLVSPYLKPDMVPESMWGENLRKYLGDAEWKRLSRECRRRTNGFCRICGVHNKPHCHEQWTFIPDSSRAGYGVQKLTDLVCLCENCHRSIHVGKARVDGRLDEAIDHLANVNGWTIEQAQAAYRKAGNEWEWRNQYRWTLDCSLVEREYGVKVNYSPSVRQIQSIPLEFEKAEPEETGGTLDVQHYLEPHQYPNLRSEPGEYPVSYYAPSIPATPLPSSYPPIQYTSYQSPPYSSAYTPPRRRGVRFRTLLIALIVGIVAGYWIVTKYMLNRRHPGTMNIVLAPTATTIPPHEQKKRQTVRRRRPTRPSQDNATHEKAPVD